MSHSMQSFLESKDFTDLMHGYRDALTAVGRVSALSAVKAAILNAAPSSVHPDALVACGYWLDLTQQRCGACKRCIEEP